MGAPWLNPRPAPFLAFQMIDARYEQAIHSRGSCYLCDCSSHALRLVLGWNATIASTEIPMWVSVAALVIAGGLAVGLWRENM